MNAIVQDICFEYCVDSDELLNSRIRNTHITKARTAAIVRLHETETISETARILKIAPSAVMYRLSTTRKRRDWRPSSTDESAWAHAIEGEDDYTPPRFVPGKIGVVQREVCEFYGVGAHDLVSTSRMKSVVLARQVATYLCHKLAPATLCESAKAFNRDHSTQIHSIRKIEALIRKGGTVANDIMDLTRRLTR